MIDGDSLWPLLERRAEATPGALFAQDPSGARLCFAAYRERALDCAARLREHGVRSGMPVSWQLPTTLDALVLAAALSRLGAVQNPLLPMLRRHEVSFIAEQLGPRLLVVPGVWRGFDHEAMAREIASAPGGPSVLRADALRGAGAGDAAPAAAPEPGSCRWVFYTSGTSADPKGVRHGDAALLASARALVTRLGLRADDRVALVFPITHVGGIGWLLASLMAGCALLVVPVFDAEATPRWLGQQGVTQGTAGTVFHQAYLAAQRARPAQRLFPAIRAFPGGGAPKPPGLHGALQRELGGAGILSGYGLTEFPVATLGALDDPDEELAESEGRPTPGVALRVVGRDGHDVRPAETGEIRLRGPQCCLGYVDARLDGDAFDGQGFLRTGDLGALDSRGHLRVTGRIKDVIVRMGENLSASEIEGHLHAHPAVAEVAVVGLPDAHKGERVCAVLVARDLECPPHLPEIAAFLRDRGLAAQKIPEQLELAEALPRNPSGKVLKRALRERYAGD